MKLKLLATLSALFLASCASDPKRAPDATDAAEQSAQATMVSILNF